MNRLTLFAAVFASLVAATALTACGSSSSASDNPTTGVTSTAATPVAQPAACTYRAGWQKLANKVGVPIYCPGWLPNPLTSQINGQWNDVNFVDSHHNYTESFVWQETGMGAPGGEIHVVIRGYPGQKKIPTCRTGGTYSQNVPCFAEPKGTISAKGITSPVYTVNQDLEQWHLLLAWHRDGNLYTISEHVAPPLNIAKVRKFLRLELASLILIKPAS